MWMVLLDAYITVRDIQLDGCSMIDSILNFLVAT